jgi:hypothetical protein
MEWTPGDGTPVVFASSPFTRIAWLSAYAKDTLQFQLGPQFPPPDKRAFARVRVFYKWPLFAREHESAAYFYTVKDSDGHFQWFHSAQDQKWTPASLPRFSTP